MERSFDWLTKHAYAHRGLFGDDIPENSLAAAHAALQDGYGIECDVRVSADGVPVVFHDKTLDRMTDQKGKIHKLQSGRILKASLQGSGETIPSLTDLLSVINGKTPLLIEVKSSFKRPVTRLMRSICAVLESYRGQFALMSFDPRIMAWLRIHAPQFCRGFVAGKDALTKRRMGLLLPGALKGGQPDFIAVDHRFLPHPVISKSHEKGTPLLTWTVRSNEEAESAFSVAEAPIFERPYDPAHWNGLNTS